MTEKNPRQLSDVFNLKIKLSPKHRQFLDICDQYGDVIEGENSLIHAFTTRLKSMATQRGHRSDYKFDQVVAIFVGKYESQLHLDETNAKNIADALSHDEMRFIKDHLKADAYDFKALLNVDDGTATQRCLLDKTEFRLAELNKSIEDQRAQLNRFYEWTGTPEYRRFVANYNWMRHRWERTERTEAKVHGPLYAHNKIS